MSTNNYNILINIISTWLWRASYIRHLPQVIGSDFGQVKLFSCYLWTYHLVIDIFDIEKYLIESYLEGAYNIFSGICSSNLGVKPTQDLLEHIYENGLIMLITSSLLGRFLRNSILIIELNWACWLKALELDDIFSMCMYFNTLKYDA